MTPEHFTAHPVKARVDATHNRALNWLYLCLLLFCLPRVNHPMLPDAIGGIEILPPVVFLALVDICICRGGLRASKDLLLFIALVPLVMLYANLTGYLVFHEGQNLVKGLMQTYRRCGAAFLAVLMWQVILNPREGVGLIKFFVWSVIVGAVLFILVENFNPLGFSNRSRLSGNFLGMAMDEAESDTALFGNIRVAGNAGSQTTYGFLVAVAAMSMLDLLRARAVGFVHASIVMVLLLGCMLLSSAKMVILTAGLALVVFMAANRRLWPVLFACALAMVLVVGGTYSVLLEAITSRSAGSLGGRLDKFSGALNLLYSDPWRLIFGDGWKSGPVGWHSEPMEFLMAFGVVPGLLLMAVLYVVFPFVLVRSTAAVGALPGLRALLFIFVIGVSVSLFHDVFLDPYTLFAGALLLGVRMRTIDEHARADVPWVSGTVETAS